MKKTTIIIVLCAVLLLTGGTVFLFTKILPDTATMGNTANGSSDSSKNSATLQSTDNTSINVLPTNDDFLKKIPKNLKDIPSNWEKINDDYIDKNGKVKYRDEQQAEYTYNIEDGRINDFERELIAYPNNELTSAISSDTINYLKSIATAFLSKYIPLDKYTYVNASYSDESGIHWFQFYRFINGYTSMDFASIRIDNSANIIGFSAPNIGIFDNIDVPEVNKSKIEENVKNQVKQNLKSIKDYTIDTMILRINDSGKLEMMVDIWYTTNDGYKAGNAFFVPLED